jgi:4-amino-4-deoxy-L-arabinose transferase-like glycosyltransferase
MNQCPKSTVWALLVLIAFALTMRLATLAVMYRSDPACVIVIDSHSYMNPARALVKLGRYAPSIERSDVPEVTRTPGYPLFLAAHYALFGERNWLPVVVQSLVGMLTLWLTFVLANRIFGRRAAWLSVVLVVVNLETFLASELLLTETLFTCLTMCFVGAAARLVTADDQPAPVGWAWAAGLALAAATLFRPITYYLLLPGIVATALLHPALRRTPGRVALACCAIALPFVLLVGGWQVRNYISAGRAELSQIQSTNLLLWRAAGIVAMRDGISLEQAQELLRKQAGDGPALSQKERAERFAGLGARILRENPVLALRTSAMGLARMVLVPGETDLMQFLGFPVSETGPARDLAGMPLSQWRVKWLGRFPVHLVFFLVGAAYLVVLYGAALVGMVVAVRSRGPQLRVHALLVMVLLYFALVSAGPEAYPRFRVPVIPLIAIYAGAGLAWVCGGRQRIVGATGSTGSGIGSAGEDGDIAPGRHGAQHQA